MLYLLRYFSRCYQNTLSGFLLVVVPSSPRRKVRCGGGVRTQCGCQLHTSPATVLSLLFPKSKSPPRQDWNKGQNWLPWGLAVCLLYEFGCCHFNLAVWCCFPFGKRTFPPQCGRWQKSHNMCWSGKRKERKKNKHLYLFQQREGHVPFPVSPGMSLAMPETPSPSPSDILPEPLAEATCLQKYLQPNPLIKRGTQLLNRSVSGVIELKVYQGQSEAKRKYSQ